MRVRLLSRIGVVVWMAWFLGIGAAAAQSASIDQFFGRYEGSATFEGADGPEMRDMAVAIEPRNGDGFHVAWTTTRLSDDGSVNEKSYAIDFERTSTPSIFQSAMRKDMFGNQVPLNPLKGDPYVWSTLYGDTLTVYALLINDAGQYELMQYDRTLAKGGLRLDFTRIREGEELKRITTQLKKVGN